MTFYIFNFKVIVQAFQEDSIGEFEITEGSLFWLGHDRSVKKTLEAQESIFFSVGMLPMQAGTFKIRFIATFRNDNSEKTCYSPSLKFKISNPETAL